MNKRINSVEFRWSDHNSAHELVRWFDGKEKEYCIVVAFFRIDKKEAECDMETVGRRWLDCYKEYPKETIALTEYAHNVINTQLRLEKDMQ